MDDNKKVSKYDEMLEIYLNEGINYSANTIKKAKQGDLEQLAADSYWQGWQDVNSENGKLPIPLVSGSLPDKFTNIIRFIESDLMEVKLYGNDGFDNQEVLDGKEYLLRLIKEALGNDR